jgi:hypothetical protein
VRARESVCARPPGQLVINRITDTGTRSLQSPFKLSNFFTGLKLKRASRADVFTHSHTHSHTVGSCQLISQIVPSSPPHVDLTSSFFVLVRRRTYLNQSCERSVGQLDGQGDVQHEDSAAIRCPDGDTTTTTPPPKLCVFRKGLATSE